MAIHYKRDGSIDRYEVKSVLEAKDTIKELKLKKKELQLLKKRCSQEIAGIKAHYQQLSNSLPRDSDRKADAFRRKVVAGYKVKSEHQVLPYEQQKRNIDAQILFIDSSVLKLESYIIKSS